MNNSKIKIFVVGLIIGFVALGCGQKAKSSSEAVELSKAKATVESQAKYLIQQANGFLNSKQFDEALNTAKYVLSKLDANSIEAKNIIEEAKKKLEKIALEKMNEVKGKIGSFGQ